MKTIAIAVLVARDKRRAWFKLLACPSHTWPITSCDACQNRVQAKLEQVCKAETEGKP